MAVGISNFPTSLDAASDLVEATNNASTQIDMVGGLSSGATTITVVSTANFPNTGIFRINNEIISYSAKTATTFTVQTRGFESTTAASHANGDLVSLDITASSNNAKNSAIIALETKIGSGSSTPTANTVLRGTGTGTSAFGQVGLTTDVTGTLPVANGGTGVTTSTGSGSTVLSTSPTLTTPNLGTPSTVTLTNATGLPLSTGVTGTLPVANGGTGNTTPYTAGQLLIGNNAGGLTKATLTAGSNVTITNGDGAITIAATGGSSGVTSFSAGTTGLTPTSNTTGAVTLSGTLGVANGGTGSSSLTANNVLLGNGTNAVQVVAPGTSGNVLTSNGTTWQSVAGTQGILRTSDASITLNASSPPNIFLINSTVLQTVTLPDVTTLTVGRTFAINCESSVGVQVAHFGNISVGGLYRNQRALCTCVNTAVNATSSWVVTYDNFLVNPAGAENYLINSAFRVDQRQGKAARTLTTGSFQFVADRWEARALGANVQVSFTSAAAPGGIIFTGSTGNTGVELRQRIEQSVMNGLQNTGLNYSKTVVISYEITTSGASGACTFALSVPTTADNFTSVTQVATGSIAEVLALTNVSLRASSAPITVTNSRGIELVITTSAIPNGATVQISNVKLEPGLLATPYVSVPFDVELARCQRYYWRQTGPLPYSYMSAFAPASSTTAGRALVTFPVQMRREPTAVETSNLHLTDQVSENFTFTATDINSPVGNAGPRMLVLGLTVASGLTAGRMYALRCDNNAAGFLGVSAEL